MSKITLVRLADSMSDGRYRIYVRLSHKHQKAMRKTDFTCEAKDSDAAGNITSMKIISQVYASFLGEWEQKMEEAERRGMTETMGATDLLDYLAGPKGGGVPDISKIDFLGFIRDYCERITNDGRGNSAMNFLCVHNTIRAFKDKETVMVSELTTEFLSSLVDYLRKPHRVTQLNHGRTVTMTKNGLNNQSLNNRIKDFKTLFNALRRKYSDPLTGEDYIRSNPFRFWKPLMVTNAGGYRSVDADVVRRIYKLGKTNDLTAGERLGADMFILSFCLLGINVVDLYGLKPSDEADGRIAYCRKKTMGRRADGAFISVEIPQLAKDIMRRYAPEVPARLLNLSERYCDPDNLTRAINRGLRKLRGRDASIPKITYYSARHSWATIARNDCGVSREDIDLALNHTNENLRMADVYVRRDFKANDANNRKVLEFVFGK